MSAMVFLTMSVADVNMTKRLARRLLLGVSHHLALLVFCGTDVGSADPSPMSYCHVHLMVSSTKPLTPSGPIMPKGKDSMQPMTCPWACKVTCINSPLPEDNPKEPPVTGPSGAVQLPLFEETPVPGDGGVGGPRVEAPTISSVFWLFIMIGPD